MNSKKLQNKMDTIFMNSANSKTSDTRRLLLNLPDKINLKSSDMLLYQILAFTVHRKISVPVPIKYLNYLMGLNLYQIFKTVKYIIRKLKKSYRNNKLKISALTWNQEFESPDGSYSVSDIQEYFMYIIRKHQKVTDNPPIRIYINNIENRINCKIKTGHYCELFNS